MLLGIDIGTTNVKVVLVEETTRQVVHKHSLPLGEPPKVDAPRGAAERSVAQIFQTLEKCMTCLESAAQLLGKVRAIGVCGQMHGCVLWNSSGHSMLNEYTRTLQHEETLSSNFITWEDTRCDSEFLYSLPKPPSSPEHSVRAGYGCATLAWLQCHNRETLSCYDRAGTIMDMVVCALCSGGSGDVIMSSQNAEGWGYFDRSSLQWHKEMLEGLFPLRFLPRVVNAPTIAGHLMREWHQIPRGTMVCVAMGDLQCAVYAANPNTSDAVLNMGSASQLALIRPFETPGSQEKPHPLIPESVLEVPYFGGDHLLVAAALGGGNTIATFVKTLQSWLRELSLEEAGVGFQDVYDKVMKCALEKVDTTLEIDPRLWGERHDPDVRGQVRGMRPDNLSLGDVGSAAVRGVVKNLYTMISPDLLQHYEVRRVLGSGKILQKHRVFREHIEEVFQCHLVLKDEADAPLGAAMAVKNLS